METRIALVEIIVTDIDSAQKINDILHEFNESIIGRMGVPHKDKNLHIISVALDASENDISSLSGKLGMLPGVSSKTVFGKKDLIREES